MQRPAPLQLREAKKWWPPLGRRFTTARSKTHAAPRMHRGCTDCTWGLLVQQQRGKGGAWRSLFYGLCHGHSFMGRVMRKHGESMGNWEVTVGQPPRYAVPWPFMDRKLGPMGLWISRSFGLSGKWKFREKNENFWTVYCKWINGRVLSLCIKVIAFQNPAW